MPLTHTPLKPCLRGGIPAQERNLKQEFDSMIPHSRGLLSLRETSQVFGVSLQLVRNWIEAGLVVAGDISCGDGRRRHYKVTRASAWAFYSRRFGGQVV